MKQIFTLFFLFAFVFTAQAQEEKLKKTEIKGGLVEVSLYYETGELMQHGFYNKAGDLHGGWESYNKNGEMTCYATYDRGVKVGTWIYWNKTEVTKVTYDRNKIVDLKVFDKDTFIKNEF
jgi:antitoxin component YwqK of YwqJK toxin-antitoxin module